MISTAVIVYKKGHRDIAKPIESIVKHSGVHHKCIAREKVRGNHVKGKDIVIVVGGDGTFLTTSHYITGNTLILSVNANPKQSVAFYSRATIHNFEKKWNQIMKGNFKVRPLMRLTVEHNKKQPIHPATNEVYFGHERPHGTARYTIKIGKKQEFQISSGVLIATAYGSYGWIRSMGHKPLALSSENFMFAVREPMNSKIYPSSMHRGILSPESKIEITCNRGESMVGIDGFGEDETKVKDGDKVIIYPCKSKLQYIENIK